MRKLRFPIVAAVALLMLIPVLTGCMTRSEHVGDEFSGFVVVAATPNTGPAAPTFDVPASMAGSVAVTPFPSEGSTGNTSNDGTPTSVTGKVGSRLTFTNLTIGQFSQLGDIVSSSLDAGATIDLGATRSGDIVRLRGGAALAGLSPQNYYLSITVQFDGRIVATNGNLSGDSSVTWVPEPGQNAEFNADAEYPDPATAAFPGWTIFLVLLCLIIVAGVGAIAYMYRDRSPRYVPSAAEREAALPAVVAALKSRTKRRAGAKGESASTGDSEGVSGDRGEPGRGEPDSAADEAAPHRSGPKQTGPTQGTADQSTPADHDTAGPSTPTVTAEGSGTAGPTS
ncbi:hypothetical protein GOHSU_02_00060 [Gordonia hirsuta DSM 44140 = NBRC 16056]|uniref:LppM domain-containing protein n=1 Tax=Gordonia hirsuta DSM 44140 = NBRC 16056 TaxID=1121927 RepID=L7L759_9ACTN|nr:hypothetical protein [Gordonia hirsuta]GAC55863.1 hypothetical protein GOHSU_02_00060 [Gordonia hirsuta DSM 44140 = NBRC 16056]